MSTLPQLPTEKVGLSIAIAYLCRIDKGVHFMEGAEIIPLNLTRVMPPEGLLTSLIFIYAAPVVCYIIKFRQA